MLTFRPVSFFVLWGIMMSSVSFQGCDITFTVGDDTKKSKDPKSMKMWKESMKKLADACKANGGRFVDSAKKIAVRNAYRHMKTKLSRSQMNEARKILAEKEEKLSKKCAPFKHSKIILFPWRLMHFFIFIFYLYGDVFLSTVMGAIVFEELPVQKCTSSL